MAKEKTQAWKDLTTDEKIAKLEDQLEKIEIARSLFDEFERLTNDWIEKVKTFSKSKKAKE
jgi:hypothetical protein